MVCKPSPSSGTAGSTCAAPPACTSRAYSLALLSRASLPSARANELLRWGVTTLTPLHLLRVVCLSCGVATHSNQVNDEDRLLYCSCPVLPLLSHAGLLSQCCAALRSEYCRYVTASRRRRRCTPPDRPTCSHCPLLAVTKSIHHISPVIWRGGHTPHSVVWRAGGELSPIDCSTGHSRAWHTSWESNATSHRRPRCLPLGPVPRRRSTTPHRSAPPLTAYTFRGK